jgi:hypothetical protein
MKTNIHFWSYIAHFFLKWEKFQTNVVEKIETCILWSTTLFPPKNRAVYEIMWKNIVQPGRPHMTVWRMRIACWIPVTADKFRIFDIYWFSTATMIARNCLSFVSYVQYMAVWFNFLLFIPCIFFYLIHQKINTVYGKYKSHTCFGTGLPFSGSLSVEGIWAQHVNIGMHCPHWND